MSEENKWWSQGFLIERTYKKRLPRVTKDYLRGGFPKKMLYVLYFLGAFSNPRQALLVTIGRGYTLHCYWAPLVTLGRRFQ